jgi:VCBS repeat-containing protein
MTKMHGGKAPGAMPKKVHKGHSWDYIAGTDGNDVFEGGRGTQIVDAGAGNDSISGGSGRDLLFGGSGADKLIGGKRGDVVFGGSGNDLLDGEGNGQRRGDGADALFGDGYESFGDLLSGKKVSAPGHDTIRGGSGRDIIFGDNGSGGSAGGNDLIEGGRGNDLLFGEGGNDTLGGGRGLDIMDGGAGNDVFAFTNREDSNGWDADLIRNFVKGQDKIDLTGALGDQAFKFCGTKPMAYGVWYVQKGGCTLVCVDLDGNPKTADMVIRVEGKIQFSADDFKTWGQNPANPTPNTPPVANNDIAAANEDGAVTVNVLANDTDANGDPLTVTGASALLGSVTINSNGTLTYTPVGNNNGGDTITYSISDGKGGTATGTVAVTVAAVNDGPVAVADKAAVNEDTAVTVNVLGNDSDIDGDKLSVTGASAGHGTVTVNSDGTLTYKGDANFNGNDTITYSISDGKGGSASSTVAVTVNAVNDGPLAGADKAATDEDTAVTINVLGNDSDVDGDKLSVTGASAGHGTVTINADGTLTYKGDANYNGNDTITYSIGDGYGGTASSTVAVTVNAVNDGPVAKDDSATTNEDTAVIVNVLGNDGDVDGDKLSVTGASAGHGSVTVNADGTLTYTPDANYSGSDTITYSVDDGHGGKAGASVVVTVTPDNDGPVAQNDSITTDEDSEVTVDVLANDSDPEGNGLTVTGASAKHGSVVINEDGTLTYTPDSNYNGSDTISYSISDGEGGTASATVAVTVNPLNDGPVAADDSASTAEDNSVTVNVLQNDSDADKDSLSVTAASALHGTVVINADGTLTYTPNANYHGGDTISYTVTDGHEATSDAQVDVTVTPVNDIPVAGKDSAVTDEDQAVDIAVLGNDGDADGDALTITGASAEHGTVTVNGDGTLTYKGNPNFHGADTITYGIDDGHGGIATAIVAVTVNSVNDGPVAKNDAATVDEDTSVTVNVLRNDSDVDGDQLAITGASAGHGTVTVNEDGTLTYKGDANYNGNDTITYSISDGKGGTSGASVAVTVNSVNDVPAAKDDSATVDEDTSVTVNVLGNDSDADGDTLSVTGASAGHGTVTVNEDGSLTYKGDANFNGTDTINYTVSDGKGGTASATVAVTVNAVNDAPVATGDVAVTDEDTKVTVNVLGNDGDVDGDSLTVTAASAAHGTVTINGDGTLIYAPTANYNGADTISYSISDGKGGTASASVSVTVNSVNDAPVAKNDTATVNEDSVVRIAVLANDSDVDGDKLSVTGASAEHGTVIVNKSGTIDYMPGTNYNGPDTITYTVSDGNGGTSTATVSVTVNPVNDQPTAGGDTAVTDEDIPVIINVLANDGDIDGDALSVTGASALHGGVTINGNGSLTYTPSANYNGPDTITYTISDGHGGSATAAVAVTVNSVNDTPVAGNDAVSVDEDNGITFGVLSNDSDVDNDALTVTGATAGHGDIIVNSNNTLTYVPNPNFNGTDTVTYTIDDGHGGTATAMVTITVNPVNDPPIAISDFAVTDEDTALNIDVLGNDSDVEGDALSVTEASAANGTVTINGDGTLHYAPNANFHGADTINYTVSDGNGGTDTATVVVTVNSVNDVPVANADAATVNEDGLVRIAVLANDMDVDGDQLTVTGASAVNGTVVVNPNNTIDYFPNADFYGTDRITYAVSDGHGGTATATVTVTVNAVNDGPTANGEAWFVTTDAVATIGANRLLANDSDRDGSPLQITAINGAGVGVPVLLSNGVTLTLLADGNISMVMAAAIPNPLAPIATFTYTISDGVATSTATSTIEAIATGSGTDTLNLFTRTGGTDPYAITFVDTKAGSEIVAGTNGNDTLFGGPGVDNMSGGLGNDMLDGGTQNGQFDGGAGNDTIRGGSGTDAMDGGAGNGDMLDLSAATSGITINLVQSAVMTSVTAGGGLGTDSYKNFEGVIGSNFGDVINGSASNDILRGGGGNDTINGNGGQDILDYSDATGALNFTLVQSSSATVYAAAGLGSDSYSNIEGVAGSAFNDTLTGSSGDDIIRGGLSADQIDGGLGTDKLRGGQGADLLTGGAGVDRFEYVNGDLAGTPTDTISDFQTGAGGDVLDIAELLVGYSGSGLQNFVQVIDTGNGNTLVRFDIDGSGTTFGFQNAVVLTGVSGVTLADMVSNGNLDVTV